MELNVMNDYHTDEELEIRIHLLYFSDPCYFSWSLWYSAIFPEKKKRKKVKIQKAKYQPLQKTKENEIRELCLRIQ